MATAIAMALPGISHGLGLGRAVGEPVLGESLLLEVPVTGTVERLLDAECVSVRRSPESIDTEYFPRDIVARIDRQGSGTRIVVTTRSTIRQPLVEFRLSIACGYNLSHDYLLMASPRREAVSQPLAAPQKADAQPVKPAAGETVQAPASGNASSGHAALPDGIAGKTLIVDKDMTLEQLARKHFPGPLRQGRFMRWVAEANPQLFADTKGLRQHKLQVGQELVIPAGVPPRRPGDYKNGLTPLGEPMPAAEADAATTASARRTATASQAEFSPPTTSSSSPPGRKDRLVVGSGSGARRDDKETVALVERLTTMMEQQVATQAANDERIKQLEATIEQLGKTIARMEKEAADREARWQAERHAEKAAREQEAERGWLQLLLAVGVGGILGAGVLQGLRMLAGRRRTPAENLEAFSQTSAGEQPATGAENGQNDDRTPLTDFGMDEETQRSEHARAVEARPAAPRQKPAEKLPQVPPITFESNLDERRTKHPEPVQSIEFEPPTSAQTAVQAEEPVPSDPATAAIELANIMTSMGLAQSAAQTLIEHIRDNPRQSLQQWLKLLEIYRISGNRAEFEKYASEVRQHFNVQPDEWAASPAKPRASLEDYPHVRSNLIKLWRKPEALPVLQALLMDNREGTRAGFPQSVAEEILLLLAMANASRS